MKKTLRIYLSGTIQGIFFRKFVKENAERHNVKGFVRNLEDGRVEAFFEGNTNDVDKMVEICKNGSKEAKIKGIEIKQENFQGLNSFKILHI